MKKTRYEEYTETRYKQIDQLSCDACGTTVDTPALHRPEGWVAVARQVEGVTKWWDFCDWDCVLGWAGNQPADGPGGYLQSWIDSIDAIKEGASGVQSR